MNHDSQRNRPWNSLVNHSSLFDEEISADVTFTIVSEGQHIKAHRLVLTARSQVFVSMFNGKFKERLSEEIRIEDATANDMKNFLRYLYTDQVNLTPENVEGILHLADKYDVSLLHDECIAFLNRNLDKENAGFAFALGKRYNSPNLKADSLSYIGLNTTECLNSDHFLTLSKEVVSDIIGCENLSCEEEQVFEFLCRWAEERYQEEGSHISGENKRAILGDLLYEVRFPIMNYKYLIERVSNSGVVTESEMIAILQLHVNGAESDNTIHPVFINTSRKSELPLSVPLCPLGDFSLHPAESPDKMQTIEFNLSDKTWFYGVVVFGPTTGENFGTEISLHSNTPNATTASYSGIVTPKEEEKTCSIKLNSPVFLDKNVAYICSVKFYPSPGCHFHCFSEDIAFSQSHLPRQTEHVFGSSIPSFPSTLQSDQENIHEAFNRGNKKQKRNQTNEIIAQKEFHNKTLTVTKRTKFIAGLLLF